MFVKRPLPLWLCAAASDRRVTLRVRPAAKIHEDYCGIEPVRHPEEEQETRPPPEVDEDIVSSLYNDINFAVLGGQRATSARGEGAERATSARGEGAERATSARGEGRSEEGHTE